jgi:uncharacterized membrane protein
MGDPNFPSPTFPTTPALPSTPEPVAAPEPVITQDERTMAVLAHALQVVGWFIAPLVILIAKRDSRFVAFHALQALLLQVLYVLLWMIFVVVWVATISGTIANARGGTPPNAAPAIMLVFPLIWLGGMVLWVLVILAAVLYSIKAGRGEWAEYPLLGKLAKRMLNL